MVIGAGIAGLAATLTLLEKGKSVVLIEASDRIGGRAQTDTSIFGVPYDLGAHWLHNANVNPFVEYGKQNGFTVYAAPDDEILYVGDREASDDEYAAYEKAFKAANATIGKAGRKRQDVAPAAVVADSGEWTDLVHFAIGPYEMAKDFDRFSCVDWWNSEDGADWYCREGYGTLVGHYGAGVPVQLNTVAKTVRWGGNGVSVETSRGTIDARAAVITVSTGVLAAGDIAFDPPLPAEKQDAFHGITMGIYNHIALQFRENFMELGDDGYLLYKVDTHGAGSPRATGLLANMSGTNLSIADVGGEFARELETGGEAAGLDFALGELRRIFGSAVDSNFVKGHVTRWGLDPLFKGSYASAEPGAYKLRAKLRAPLAERLYFAGEACSSDEWATVSGAYKTGVAVGKSLAGTLK